MSSVVFSYMSSFLKMGLSFRFVFVALIILVVFVHYLLSSNDSPLSAKTSSLPRVLVTSLEDAAKRPGSSPNYGLTAAVIAAMSEYPLLSDEIVSLAISLAPSQKEFLIKGLRKYFPGLKYTNSKLPKKIIPRKVSVKKPITSPSERTAAVQSSRDVQVSDKNISVSEEHYSRRSNQTYYMTLGAGAAFLVDSIVEVHPASSAPDGTLSFYTGYSFTGAFGLRFPSGIRTEFEVAYRYNNIDVISNGFADQTISIALDIGGHVSSMAYMTNLLYDFSLSGEMQPFLGVGLGLASITADTNHPSLQVSVDDTDTVFATQLIAGTSFRLSEKGLLGLKYHFFLTENPELTVSNGDMIEGEYYSHNVLAYLTYEF